MSFYPGACQVVIGNVLRRCGASTADAIASTLKESQANTLEWLRELVREGMVDFGVKDGETRYWLTDLGLRKLQ